MVLHVHSTDGGTIAEALQSLLQMLFDPRMLIGQGYDGAATFAGKISGVHERIQTSSAHTICIHCFCHSLQIALNSGSCISDGDTGVFWNHDQCLDVLLLFPPPPPPPPPKQRL